MTATKGFALDGDMLHTLISEGPSQLIASWPELASQTDRLEQLQGLLRDMDALERLQRRTSQLLNGVVREVETAMATPAV